MHIDFLTTLSDNFVYDNYKHYFPRSFLFRVLGFLDVLPPSDLDAGDDGDDDEPEPEEDVDLLVDDVEGEDAQRVKLLHRAGGAELVELALCHLEQRRSWTDFCLKCDILQLSSLPGGDVSPQIR